MKRKNKFHTKGGGQAQSEKSDLHCIRYNRDDHDASICNISWDKVEKKINESEGKNHGKEKGKTPKSTHYAIALCNIRVTKDLFNASLTA